MKIAITFVVGLIAGLVIGWFVGYINPRSVADRRAVDYMRKYVPSFRDTAIVGVEAIRQIQVGDTNMAIRTLSVPIADYYYSVSTYPDTNGGWKGLRSAIDELARTNRVVAESMREEHHAMRAFSKSGAIIRYTPVTNSDEKP